MKFGMQQDSYEKYGIRHSYLNLIFVRTYLLWLYCEHPLMEIEFKI